MSWLELFLTGLVGESHPLLHHGDGTKEPKYLSPPGPLISLTSLNPTLQPIESRRELSETELQNPSGHLFQTPRELLGSPLAPDVGIFRLFLALGLWPTFQAVGKVLSHILFH